ncbi:MAG TPA: hypothetical protein VM491_17015 [Burkholderiaceae bacterium]|nr:hypothetical protein [Burkholderiaceae bacterium]
MPDETPSPTAASGSTDTPAPARAGPGAPADTPAAASADAPAAGVRAAQPAAWPKIAVVLLSIALVVAIGFLIQQRWLRFERE